MFALTNFGYVHNLPGDWEILLEGSGAAVAAAALAAGAVAIVRRRRAWIGVLAGTAVFAITMLVSVVTGTSDPQMLMLSVVIPACTAVFAAVERLKRPR